MAIIHTELYTLIQDSRWAVYYLPTIICSLGEAFFLILSHMSIVNIVLLELNIEVSDDMSAANMTASIIPRAPASFKCVQMRTMSSQPTSVIQIVLMGQVKVLHNAIYW